MKNNLDLTLKERLMKIFEKCHYRPSKNEKLMKNTKMCFSPVLSLKSFKQPYKQPGSRKILSNTQGLNPKLELPVKHTKQNNKLQINVQSWSSQKIQV